MALESEWETFVSPLLLLAGAEVLSAGLEHLRLQPDAKNKIGHIKTLTTLSASASLACLYQQINLGLLRTQEVLCEPFLRQPTSSLAAPSEATCQNHFVQAKHLAVSISSLVTAINVRCQLIDLQAALFGIESAAPGQRGDAEADTTTPTLAAAASAVTLFIETIASTVAAASSVEKEAETILGTEAMEATERCSVEPILSSLMQELKMWKFCLETCAALERCQ